MRCRLILAVAGLLATLSLAQAQQFAPKPVAPASIHAAVAPLPSTIEPIVQASARSANCGPVVAYGEGCAAAPAHSHSCLSKLFIGKGTAQPNGCGCIASERTFLFGSCKQFYNPQKDCRTGCCNGCWPVDRRTPGEGVTSYLNR